MALLRLEPGDDPDDRGVLRQPVLLAQRAARVLVVVALEVHAVVDERDRGRVAALVAELLDDRTGDRDDPVHPRGQAVQDRPVLVRADPARMDGRDDVRSRTPDLAERDRRPRPDELGAVHVVVDDLRPKVAHQGGQRAGRDRVVRLVDDRDRDAVALELADGAPVGERHDMDVVAGRVDPGQEAVDVLLGAAVRAGREELQDPDAAARDRRPGDGVETGIAGTRSAHRPTDRRMSSRWIGSSTAPHSYLYGSFPRRKSILRRPEAIARSTYLATSTTPGERSRASGSTPAL